MMVSRIMMTLLMVNFLMIGEISAMEPEKKGPQKTIELAPFEEDDLKKRMLLGEHAKNQDLYVPKEVHDHIGGFVQALHSNPVLDGMMEYTNPSTKEKISFKIDTRVKDGMIDLSGEVFGNLANSLVIAVEPDKFFADHGEKIVVLIAPWFLIHVNLKSSCAPFQPIMAKWDRIKAPIGIFCRGGNLDKRWYSSNTHTPISDIKSTNMYKLYFDANSSEAALHAGHSLTTWAAAKIPYQDRMNTQNLKLNFEVIKN